jgi:hypothetical protein
LISGRGALAPFRIYLGDDVLYWHAGVFGRAGRFGANVLTELKRSQLHGRIRIAVSRATWLLWHFPTTLHAPQELTRTYYRILRLR